MPKKMPTEKRIITTMISSALMSDKHIDEPEIGGQGTENRYNSIELSMEMQQESKERRCVLTHINKENPSGR